MFGRDPHHHRSHLSPQDLTNARSIKHSERLKARGRSLEGAGPASKSMNGCIGVARCAKGAPIAG
jgi:hypothetical protein